jgi:hypothetical protein
MMMPTFITITTISIVFLLTGGIRIQAQEQEQRQPITETIRNNPEVS